MSYDTFWTHSYKGGFINGKRDTATGAEVITYQLPNERQWREAKSYRAAQQRISRFGVRLTPSEEFHLNGFVCEETVRHLLDYQITFNFVQTVQEQLDGIFKCLPEDNTEWWVNEIEERIAKVEALLSNYQETLE